MGVILHSSTHHKIDGMVYSPARIPTWLLQNAYIKLAGMVSIFEKIFDATM